MMKLLYDTWLIFSRAILLTLRSPIRSLIGLFQPICFLVLFAPLLSAVLQVPGLPGSSLNIFTPGLLIMMSLYGSAFVGFSLIFDLRAGVIERMLVTPVSRLALLLGRSLRDILVLFIQATILVLLSIPFGLKVYLSGVIFTFILVMLVGLVISSLSYTLALIIKDVSSFAPLLNFFLIPLQLLSGILLPLSLGPAWIRTLARFNPLAHAVTAARALFNGNLTDSSIGISFGLMAGLAIITLFLAVRTFRRVMA